MSRPLLIALIAAVVGGLVAALLGRQLRPLLARVPRRALVLGLAGLVGSGLLYSVIHEFGHYVFAVALGGSIRSATWTIFSAEEPHVSYGHMPPQARPWASAGGHILPTAAALVLVAVWTALAHRRSDVLAALTVAPAAVMLLPNLGCVFELVGQGGHMSGLASYYGLGTWGRIVLQLLPAAVSLAAFAAIWWRWNSVRGRSAPGPADEEP